MYKSFYFFIFISIFTFILIAKVEAWIPDFVNPESSNDIFIIEDASLLQAFHGELNNSPHTYEITVDKPIILYVKILIPDIESSQNIISGIIIKEQEIGGRVIEIARLIANSAVWESQFELASGDSYRKGPVFEEEIEKGTYRIEVNTPDNIGKYVLVIGTDDGVDVGYFELLGRLIEVKRFFGKTPFLVAQSPYVYVPIIFIVGVFLLYQRKRYT